MPNLNEKTSAKKYPITVVYGPSGSGKTRLVGTSSVHYKERALKDRTSMIDLTDVLVLQFDKDGIQTLQSLGMEPLYYDFSNLPPAEKVMTWVAGLFATIENAKKVIAERNIKYVVVDTLSSLTTYLESCMVPAAKDPRQGYFAAQNVTRSIVLALGQLPCPQVWLSHSKNIVSAVETEEGKARKEASLPGEFKTDLALTYGMIIALRRHFSNVFFLDSDVKTGKRELITDEKNGLGVYVKNRYPDLFSSREPANLRMLFEKIEAFEKQLAGGK